MPCARAMLTIAVFERLPQRLERGSDELGHLVEQQHAAVREARLARTRAWPAADDGRHRGAVMRRAEGRRDDQRPARGRSSPATEWMRVTSSASSGARAGRTPGSRRASIVLPVPGGPASRRLWRSCGCDLERAPAALLPTYVGEIRMRRRRAGLRSTARTEAARSRREGRPQPRRDAGAERARCRRVRPRQPSRRRRAAARTRPCAHLRRRRARRLPDARGRRARARRRPRARAGALAGSDATPPARRARSAGRSPSPPCAGPPARG